MTNPRPYDIAKDLLECARLSLIDTTNGEPDKSCVLAGSVAWDDCECGLLTMSMQRSSPSNNFPNQADNSSALWSVSRCGHPLEVWVMNATILRCAPTGGPREQPPTCEELEAYALGAIEDEIAIRAAVECCLNEMRTGWDGDKRNRRITDWLTGTATFVGPQGACGGSTMPITVGLMAKCACGNA